MQLAGATVEVNRGVEIVGGGVTDTQPVNNRGINFAWPGFRVNTESKNIYIQSPIPYRYHTCNVNKHTRACISSVDVQSPGGSSVCSSEGSHRTKTVGNIL